MVTVPGKFEQLAQQLKEISESLATEEPSQLAAPSAKRVRKTISEAYTRLRKVMDDLDPIKHPGFMFDPSNPNVVGRIVGITMIAQARKPLANIERFYGAGVYALYYSGDFPAYSGISRREHPIYVGKADPADAASKTAMEQGDRLARRLTDHWKNIAKAETTLRLEDFEYRALVVQTGWQTSAEDYLIHLFKPIWNSEVGICYGFGKHGDDPGTRANLRSPWDTLHPGRDWAHRDPNMKDARPPERIIEEISLHLAKYPPVASIDEILRRFLEEMRAVS
ncbi:MAG TPA: Eco29kI family restriction endonuclease [Bryobacteraceae bacterium]|nr:Eco29kI family restriction endonuclease [Bryobacteraceae bacterium]